MALVRKVVLAVGREVLHVSEPLGLIVLVDALLPERGYDHIGSVIRTCSIRISSAVVSFKVAVLAFGDLRILPFVDGEHGLELEVVLHLSVDWRDGIDEVERADVGRGIDESQFGVVVLAHLVLQGDEESCDRGISQKLFCFVFRMFHLFPGRAGCGHRHEGADIAVLRVHEEDGDVDGAAVELGVVVCGGVQEDEVGAVGLQLLDDLHLRAGVGHVDVGGVPVVDVVDAVDLAVVRHVDVEEVHVRDEARLELVRVDLELEVVVWSGYRTGGGFVGVFLREDGDLGFVGVALAASQQEQCGKNRQFPQHIL